MTCTYCKRHVPFRHTCIISCMLYLRMYLQEYVRMYLGYSFRVVCYGWPTILMPTTIFVEGRVHKCSLQNLFHRKDNQSKNTNEIRFTYFLLPPEMHCMWNLLFYFHDNQIFIWNIWLHWVFISGNNTVCVYIYIYC